MGNIGLEKVQRAMGSVLARDDVTAHGSGAIFNHGGGTRSGTLSRRRGFALDYRAFVIRETI